MRRGSTRASSSRSASTGASPTSGPARLHPSAGAVAVGARPFLIAYNINLDSDDVDLAKRIARRVRESGGGLPTGPGQRLRGPRARTRPPAPGAGVDEPARLRRDAAVARLGDGRRDRRRRMASSLAESELIGLAPLAAFLAVADHAGAPPDAPVEERLAGRGRVPAAARLHAAAGARAPARGGPRDRRVMATTGS